MTHNVGDRIRALPHNPVWRFRGKEGVITELVPVPGYSEFMLRIKWDDPNTLGTVASIYTPRFYEVIEPVNETDFQKRVRGYLCQSSG